ncbi:Hypothetical protein CINCED_3A012280, partial [Cinara cedri]
TANLLQGIGKDCLSNAEIVVCIYIFLTVTNKGSFFNLKQIQNRLCTSMNELARMSSEPDILRKFDLQNQLTFEHGIFAGS